MQELEKQHLIWTFHQASSKYGKQSVEVEDADRAKFLEGMAVGLLRAADIVADTKKPAAGTTATDSQENYIRGKYTMKDFNDKATYKVTGSDLNILINAARKVAFAEVSEVADDSDRASEDKHFAINQFNIFVDIIREQGTVDIND